MKLIIPPNSLVHDKHSNSYVGRVQARIAITDHSRIKNKKLKRRILENPVAIGWKGDKKLLSPLGLFCSCDHYCMYVCTVLCNRKQVEIITRRGGS